MNLNNNKFKPGLYCVATPIGNMGDISFRAIETLRKSDLILCEDTRVSKNILKKFEIKKKIISNHKFNEVKNLKFVLELLKNKKVVSLVSDAGTPALSDPGKILVNECVKNGIDVFPIPGPSAVSAAISISGFSDNFYFCGFLPEKQNQIRKLFQDLSILECSIAFLYHLISSAKELMILKNSFQIEK